MKNVFHRTEKSLPLSLVKFSVHCYQTKSPKPGNLSDVCRISDCNWPVAGFFYGCTAR